MTQKTPVNKTDENTLTDRRAFLGALYGSAPDDLYLELRCINPTTGEVQTLWGRMGKRRELASVLKQADALNRKGFGVYFAPCLRNEKKGNADSAVWVPALWIDIDDEEQHRQRGLEKLRSFDPPPSLILDSGGGWHGYWLLDEPFQLQNDTDRQKIVAILRGLFTALDGDPGYVKSVASVMRLPDSVNTKPERGSVVVSIIESHPERCHSLSQFGWLENDPRDERIGNMRVIAFNVDGYHPLPPRTEHYVASGAHEGSRNSELFAAACPCGMPDTVSTMLNGN